MSEHLAPLLVTRIGATTAVECAVEPGTRLRNHQHDTTHVCVVLGGDFTERTGGRSRHCRPGTMRWSRGGVSHAIDFGTAGGRCLIIHLDLPVRPRPFDHRFVDADPAGPLVAAIRDAAFGGEPPALRLECLTVELATRLAADTTRRTGVDGERLDRVRDRIHEADGTRIDLATLAAVAGCHPSHLTRAFRNRFGITMGDYQRRLLIDRACALLRTGRFGLGAAAHAAGFADQAHMTRMFRRYLGVSPGRFRRADSVQDPAPTAA